MALILRRVAKKSTDVTPAPTAASVIARSGEPVPVKTEKAVAKDKIFDVVNSIKSVKIDLPVKMGDVIIENVSDTGVNVVSTRSVE